MIIDPPSRTKPRKNKEILQILDDITDNLPPKRPKKATPSTSSTQLAIAAPQRNRLRVVPT